MIRIVWNNLVPPGYSQQDIVDFLLIPAIFHNPELGEEICKSTFYTRKKRGYDNGLDFPTHLTNDKTYRTRLFSYKKESSAVTERMLELLLLKTANENTPYTIWTFPIRHAFKKQWKKILSPITEEQKVNLTADKSGFYYTSDNRRLLSEDEISYFKKYIKLFWKPDSKPDEFKSYRRNWDKSVSGKGVTPQDDEINVSFKYNNQTIELSTLLNSIPVFDYSTSTYLDETTAIDLTDEDNVFYERLATMSVVASAWYIWEEACNNPTYAEQIIRLAVMIFPTEQFREIFNAEDNTNSSIVTSDKHTENKDTVNAEIDLSSARALISKKQYDEAGVLCETIFNKYKKASDHAIGTALAYLVECCENGYKRPLKFKTIDDIKKEAINRQCLYISKKRACIKSPAVRSASSSVGLFTVNCNNVISKHIIETAPKNWESVTSVTPETTIVPRKKQRIILINDDYNTNMQDALNVLDHIKKSTDNKETIISDWNNLELYIRCNEEEVTPLLDTSLSYFTEDTTQNSKRVLSLIRIYLIDEAKRSAEYLFARHPHFYPLTLASNDHNEKHTIHLVIVSNNPDYRYAKWLIKEGFWTLPRFDKSITSKITLISPDASGIGYSIISECPGLEGYSFIDGKKTGECLKINDINFPSVEYKQTVFTNRALHNELKNTLSSEDYLYFVIDADSDMNGIQLGITIRELVIRKAVFSGRISSYSKKDYTIAVHCLNPDYAGLAQELIIPKEEEHANQWFNDYNFITWGSLEDLYSWEQLDGGIIETLSQCIHLQYCNSSYDKSECKEHLTSYFKRLYNHDSSFAAAISLPYRLFEAGVIPRAWFIQNADAWWSDRVREELADAYYAKLFPDINNRNAINENLLRKIAQYEHMRWCCYQLTRGWLPVDGEQVVQYISAGVKRHSLQIAKLHPCICSWKNLQLLHKELSDAATRRIPEKEYEGLYDIKEDERIGTYEDRIKAFEDAIKPNLDKKFADYFSPNEDYTKYQRIDNQNIKQTADILKKKWNPDKIFDTDEKLK